MISKFHFTFAFFLIMFCYACPSSSNTITKMNSLIGTWELVSIQDQGRTEKNPYDNRSVVLSFDDDESIGKISGKDICGNTVFGDYTLSSENAIKIDRFGGTKRGCDGWASNFWGLIRAATTYEADDRQLKIYFNKKSSVLIFDKTS